MDKSSSIWLKGLIAATISGAANAITLVVLDPVEFAHSERAVYKIFSAALVSGVVGAALYLKQSPLPPNDDD